MVTHKFQLNLLWRRVCPALAVLTPPQFPFSRLHPLEHRLRVFENKVLRRIFGPKRDEVTGGWRKLEGV
jgi:hypothetical protein